MDFGGPDYQIRVCMLHPDVTFDEVQDNTGFDLGRAESITQTPAPTVEQLKIIREFLDPHDWRASVFKGNPSGVRKES